MALNSPTNLLQSSLRLTRGLRHKPPERIRDTCLPCWLHHIRRISQNPRQLRLGISLNWFQSYLLDGSFKRAPVQHETVLRGRMLKPELLAIFMHDGSLRGGPLTYKEDKRPTI
ncbi:hypothetical protein CRM22_006102 [Opisthorchis felineus]|uniref:Uncharacterized protein n=1 Tax=Opisthorchis felineus TaxID=147828 RepID=A0A4S2LTU9_OPIFE|nr:hypothetical protein CRM22_006102 [Opisthorchis felineus]